MNVAQGKQRGLFYVVRPAMESDRESVMACWRPVAHWLGNGGLAWKRFMESGNDRERWDVAAEANGTVLGFAHWLQRLDGARTLYEIAVHPDARRRGVARELVRNIGCPLTLKTDDNNPESNPFYEALGFRCMGQVRSRNGHRLLNVYTRYE